MSVAAKTNDRLTLGQLLSKHGKSETKRLTLAENKNFVLTDLKLLKRVLAYLSTTDIISKLLPLTKLYKQADFSSLFDTYFRQHAIRGLRLARPQFLAFKSRLYRAKMMNRADFFALVCAQSQKFKHTEEIAADVSRTFVDKRDFR